MIKLNAPRFLEIVSAKTLVVPDGGWHAHSFAVHGAAMVKAMHRAAQITQRRAIPVVARAAVKVFNLQLEKVIRIMERHHGKRSVKVGFELGPPSFVDVAFHNDGALWLEALQQVFDETGNELTVELLPPIQSVMAQGYSKTNLLLGQEAAVDVGAMVARRSQGIAQKITRINETTRKEFARIINDSVESGSTFYETVQALRTELPQINASRQLTIARTEMSNAWTQGSVESYKESDTLETVSVIGCTAREPESPQWKGESTCNYPDLPVTDLDAFMAVGFHPNHTGTMVPSQFKNADGTSDKAWKYNPDQPRVPAGSPEGGQFGEGGGGGGADMGGSGGGSGGVTVDAELQNEFNMIAPSLRAAAAEAGLKEVRMVQTASELGPAFQAGSTTVASYGENGVISMVAGQADLQENLRHEVGHALDPADSTGTYRVSESKEWLQASDWKQGKDGSYRQKVNATNNPVTEYAKTSPWEDFAETFRMATGSKFDQRVLQRFAPARYEFMKSFLAKHNVTI